MHVPAPNFDFESLLRAIRQGFTLLEAMHPSMKAPPLQPKVWRNFRAYFSPTAASPISSVSRKISSCLMGGLCSKFHMPKVAQLFLLLAGCRLNRVRVASYVPKAKAAENSGYATLRAAAVAAAVSSTTDGRTRLLVFLVKGVSGA